MIITRPWPAQAPRTSDTEESTEMMRFRAIRLAATAALAVAAGAALAAPPAIAATPACGSSCVSFYPLSTGTSDVLAVSNPSRSAYTGEPVTIAAESSTNDGEDWVLSDEGTVSEFYELGLVSPEIDLHWGSDEAYEIEYAPNGVETGLCMGTSSSNGSGAVSLRPCGETAATLWIADTADQDGRAVPLISGDDNNYSNPYSLDAGSPGSQLTSSELLTTVGSPPVASQEWGTIYGVL
jgi:hypothetical protein